MAGKKHNVYKFVAVVVMVEADGDLLVAFFKRINGGTFQNGCDDESWVEDAYILKKLPLSTMDNRGIVKLAVAPQYDG